jgi:glycosyltransferase involved in cell wall biosynthesis
MAVSGAENDAVAQLRAEERGGSLTFIFLDVPSWVRRRLPRWIGRRIAYLVWQRSARGAARRLHKEIDFDVVHHVTFANVWLPVGAVLSGVPFVLGPVGGGPRVALRFWPELGVRGAASEAFRLAAQGAMRIIPSVRKTWRVAGLILVQNRETMDVLPSGLRSKCRIRHNATFVAPLGDAPSNVDEGRGSAHEGLLGLCACRLVPWKGVSLAVRALVALPEWRLLVVGRGPESGRLNVLAKRLGVDARVEFLEWLPRTQLHEVMRRVDVVVVPSLRDDSSFIAAEAHALGVPVAAFAQGGLETLAELPDTSIVLADLPSDRAMAATALSHAIAEAAGAPRPTTMNSFSIDGIAEDLREIYATVSDRPRPAKPVVQYNATLQ